MSRLNQFRSDSVEQRVSEIMRDLEELKTAQITGQSSGMLAKKIFNSVRSGGGDVVDFSYMNGVKKRTAEIPLPRTENMNTLNTLYINHTFTPKNAKNALAFPFLKFEVMGSSGAAESQNSFNNSVMFSRSATITKNGEKVCEISNAEGFGYWFNEKYSEDSYKWISSLDYSASEQCVLKITAWVISNDNGELTTEVKGLYNET